MGENELDDIEWRMWDGYKNEWVTTVIERLIKSFEMKEPLSKIYLRSQRKAIISNMKQ